MTRGRRTRSKSHARNQSASKGKLTKDKSKNKSANMMDDYHQDHPETEFKRRGKV